MTPAKWFARGGGMAKMGPFESQVEAAAALITTEGYPVEGAFVWPEEPAQTRRLARKAQDASMKKKGDMVMARLYNVLAAECGNRGMKMPRGTR